MKQNLTATVTERLKKEILSGVYKPGDRLPALREMAVSYNVSRSVINAAVVDLESNGYIKIVPTKWMEVADWETEGSLSVVADLISLKLCTRDQLADLLDGRKLLELECVRKACEKATDKDRDCLWALINEEAAETDPVKRADCDMRFHSSICRMSGNMVYGIIMKAFEDSSHPLTGLFYQDPEVLGFVSDKHRRIAQAIEDHDAGEAELQLRLLLEHGEDKIMNMF